jgi:biotin carboxyl carrier protein
MLLTLYYSYAYEDDIKTGMDAQISIPSSMSLVDAKVSGVEKVRKITPEGAVLFEVEFTMENPGVLTKDMMATAILTAPSGEDIIPAEPGSLRFAKEQTLTLGTGGKVTTFNMREYYTYDEGTTLCQVEYTADMSRVEANNTLITKNREKIAEEQKKYQDLSVRSPIDGTVMYNKLIVGQTAEPGQAVISVAQLDNMIVEAQIDERNIGGVEVGKPVMLEQWTDKGTQTFSGTVQSVSLQAVTENGFTYFPAVISADNFDGTLLPNMNIGFTVTLNQVTDVLIAPVNAVKFTPAGETVFVKTETPPENVVELPPEIVVPPGFYPVTVVTGLGTTMGVEIVSGVNEGDLLYTQDMETDPENPEGGEGGTVDGGGMVRVAVGAALVGV